MTKPLSAIKKKGKKGLERDSKGRFIAGKVKPKGRPAGTPNKITALFRNTVEKDLPEIMAVIVDAAKNGDMAACRLLIDKAVPSIKPTEQAHAVPVAGDTLSDKAASIVDAVAAGALSIDEATRLLQALASVARIVEADELELRIAALEGK